MKVFVTGEKGFIGSSLVRKLKDFGFKHVSSESPEAEDMKLHKPGELCVYQNNTDAWSDFFFRTKTDVIIHNAAIVGTDVVALNPNEATLTNVAGTYSICRAAKRMSIPVCYMGTTVIYDVAKYQNDFITEKSELSPKTLYGCQKLCAEDIVKSQTGGGWMIIRPLFAYGGEGDMNSLIAKTVYGYINKRKNIDMFLDPKKIKDYMHVSDYSDAVLTAISQGCWGEDWNVSAETPLETGEIIDIVSRKLDSDIEGVLEWHPRTDYLGNHRLSSQKFRSTTGWSPKVTLEAGIEMSISEIRESLDYDPLVHLDEADKRNVDLTKFY